MTYVNADGTYLYMNFSERPIDSQMLYPQA
jgi:hypothetical protein